MRESLPHPPQARASSRDPVLDVLRGFFLTLMTVDHLDGALAAHGYQAFGYVTAAEGFVVLSGFVAARVYGRMRARDASGFRKAVLQRTLLLYAAHVSLVVVTLAAVWAGGGAGHQAGPYAPFARAPLEYVLKACALLFQPYLLDVLPMYVLFVAGLPLLLRAMDASRLGVFALSMTVWLGSQWLRTETWIEGSGVFVFPSWQLLFVGGALLGRLPRRFTSSVVQANGALAAAVAVIVGGLVLRYGAPGLVPGWWVERPKVGPLRLLTVVAFAVVIARVRRPSVVPRGLAWFEFLGRHSLYVFVWHFPVVLLAKPERFVSLLRDSGLAGPAPALAVDLGVTLVACLSLAIPAWLHARWRARARRPVQPVPAVELGSCQ